MALVKPTSDELEAIGKVPVKKFKPRFDLADLFSAKPLEVPHPLRDRVVVQIASIPEKTKAGIHISDKERELMRYGQFVVKVLAIGSDAFSFYGWEKTSKKERFKVGDYIVIGRNDGFAIEAYTADGQKVRLKNIVADNVTARVSSPLNFEFTT